MLRLNIPLVLASGSPRRRELLDRLGLVFEVQPSDVDEELPSGLLPADGVQRLAVRKASATAASRPEALTLGSDTVVVLSGQILGKPVDSADAHRMLRWLSGRTHSVYSGLALLHPATGRTATGFERTEVTFGELSVEEIRAYVETGSPLDKAGAYGIQDDHGALFVDRIEGDYYNVVGLPLRCLYRMLRRTFPDLLASTRD